MDALSCGASRLCREGRCQLGYGETWEKATQAARGGRWCDEKWLIRADGITADFCGRGKSWFLLVEDIKSGLGHLFYVAIKVPF